ncbi:MAG: hypothetical protein LBN71_11520 [Tannerella sp.]|jgi:predicted NBD/HSP70 family sugar kinase|nr:hypothetical protein [Tannerella sp.]
MERKLLGIDIGGTKIAIIYARENAGIEILIYTENGTGKKMCHLYVAANSGEI